jgi:periplasmic divalent cation tolerance protein
VTKVGVVLVTAPSEEAAASIGKTIVEEGLIACANLVPRVRSLYRWQGKLCDEAEVLVVMKTRRSEFERVRARVKALHPYEVPEVILVDVAQGHAPYLDWVLGAVPAPKKSARRRRRARAT